MNMELRMQTAEFQSNEDGSMKVSGYVNETGKRSNVLGRAKKFVEVISPGAFTRAIENRKSDIDFLDEHDSKRILASTRNGSLELREDERGLFMSATITPTSWGKDAYTLIDSGILKNMSFGFRSLKDSWKNVGNGIYERVVEDLELFEVSVVRVPAYSQSSIAARGINLIEDVEIPDELEKEKRYMEHILEAIKALDERFNSLAEKVDEVRSTQTEEIELRKKAEQDVIAADEKRKADEAEKLEVEEKRKAEELEKEKEQRSLAAQALADYRSILDTLKQEEK